MGIWAKKKPGRGKGEEVEELTVLNRYRLVQGAPHFRVAIAALVARVEAEGHPGVLTYRFFVNEQVAEVRAVITYADAAAWIGHHERSMGWAEMAGLHQVARLEEITFLGDVPGPVLDWLAGSGLTARVSRGYGLAAGFHRTGQGKT